MHGNILLIHKKDILITASSLGISIFCRILGRLRVDHVVIYIDDIKGYSFQEMGLS